MSLTRARPARYILGNLYFVKTGDFWCNLENCGGKDFFTTPKKCCYLRVSRVYTHCYTTHCDLLKIYLHDAGRHSCRQIWRSTFSEFTGIYVDRISRNCVIYGFPVILEVKIRFFPGKLLQNFSKIGGTPTKIPGNLVQQLA